jgi:AraC-like DNA-binding protein
MPDQRIVRAIAIIENVRPAHKLSIADVASRVGLSVSHFAHLFRAGTGVPPAHYIKAAKLRSAARLLAGTRVPVGEAARASGFSDVSHFVRDFKLHYQVSPGAFRRSAFRGTAPAEPWVV